MDSGQWRRVDPVCCGPYYIPIVRMRVPKEDWAYGGIPTRPRGVEFRYPSSVHFFEKIDFIINAPYRSSRPYPARRSG